MACSGIGIVEDSARRYVLDRAIGKQRQARLERIFQHISNSNIE